MREVTLILVEPLPQTTVNRRRLTLQVNAELPEGNFDWRRRPDLNRGWRFCRPLPYHLATAPLGERSRRLGKTASYQSVRGQARDGARAGGRRAGVSWAGLNTSGRPRHRPTQGAMCATRAVV